MAEATVDRILAALTVDVEAFAVCDLARDRSIVIRPLDLIEVHLVLEGELFLAIGDTRPLRFGPGTVILVPPRTAQWLGGSFGARTSARPADIASDLGGGMTRFDASVGEPVVRVMCGQISADVGGSFGLFDGIGAPLHAALGDDPFVQAAVAALRREVEHRAVGARALSSALLKACLLLLVRRLLDDQVPHRLPALFGSPSLLRAIAAVIDEPSAPHSVASLAATAGMSRSSFARRFAASVRLKPMEFVGQARIARARQLLVSTGLPVATVATTAGFASRSHFSRSFRDAFGLDPTRYRRAQMMEIADHG